MPPASPSPYAGMGAIPVPGGVSFRVWAPRARNVAVIGDFCGWRTQRKTPLARDHRDSGTWSGVVAGAGVGSQYRFLVRYGGPYLWRIDPFARQVTGAAGNAVVFDPRQLDWGTTEFRMPAWEDLVVYELHIPTFGAGAHGPGTFWSAIGRLDHLAWLGITAVEVMPPFEFAGSVSWGYNPSHLFAIESSYGGPLAFAAFVRAAHERGIAVILDVVHNHLGPGDLNLWRFDGWHKRGYGGSFFYNDRRAETPWGATRPNYERKEVRNYLRDSALMWLEDFRFDGLRFDGTNYIRSRWGDVRDPGQRIRGGHDYLASLTADLRSRQPWKLLIAEDMQSDPAVTRESADGGLGFHAQWAAGFVHPVRAALEAARDEDRDIQAVAAALADEGRTPYERVIFTESHDEVANGKARLPETISPGAADSWPARARAALGLALVLTAPGIPMLFQGQDFLEDGWFDDRRPLDWDKQHRHAGFLHLVRQLIALRRNLTGVTRGLSDRHTAIIRADDSRPLLAYHRWSQGGPGDDVVVLVNLGAQPLIDYRLGLPRPGDWRLRCNTAAPVFGIGPESPYAGDVGTTPGECDGHPQSAQFRIGPYAALVYSQDA